MSAFSILSFLSHFNLIQFHQPPVAASEMDTWWGSDNLITVLMPGHFFALLLDNVCGALAPKMKCQVCSLAVDSEWPSATVDLGQWSSTRADDGG